MKADEVGNPGTALITGASSGIGAAFAKRLAMQGFRLMLVSRRKANLQSLADALKQASPVQISVVPADLARDEGTGQVEKLLWQEPVDILINNAGFGTLGKFHEVDLAKHLDMLAVHAAASVRLSYAAIPGMISRRRGAIINVCSVNAFVPGHAVYSGTKAFLVMFSRALASELKDCGVRVQALCPGFTHTAFHDGPDFAASGFKKRVPAFLWDSPERVVDASLKALGKGRVICVPTFKYKLIVAAFNSGAAPLFMRLLLQFKRK